MHFIIETSEQLLKFSTYDMSDSFIEPILASNTVHPALSPVIAYYIKPNRSKRGFMLMIDHSESFSLSQDEIIDLFEQKVDKIYVSDKKKVKQHLPLDKTMICLKTLQWLFDGTVLDDIKWNTVAHSFFYNKYPDKVDINKIVPISKWQEKWNNYYQDNKKLLHSPIQKKGYFKFYNNLVSDTLFNIEIEGLSVDVDKLKQYYPEVVLKNMSYIETDSTNDTENCTVYTNYNFFTSTGRPSNSFNKVNFGAMNKGDSSRSFIIPRNSKLIEFDFHSYHPKMLTNLIGYQFEEDDIHSHLGKLYFDKEELTEEEYAESKNLTFKLLYTNSSGYDHIPFLEKVKLYKESMWKKYKELGYLESIISKRPIIGISSKTQILPYLLQSYETERNTLLINEIQKCLKDKKTKLVLYSYDAFLIDFDINDGVDTVQEIQDILEQEDYKVSIKTGKNYSNLKQLSS